MFVYARFGPPTSFGVLPTDEVHFSRDIRPILNQNCMPCHGGVRQKNGVSFLFREEALGTGNRASERLCRESRMSRN